MAHTSLFGPGEEVGDTSQLGSWKYTNLRKLELYLFFGRVSYYR